MVIMTPVSGNIRRFRLTQGITQSELARRALVTPANLSAIESGRRDLTVGTLLRIARALDLDPALLFSTPPQRGSLGRVPLDYVARAVVTGVRPYSQDVNRLADGLAWRCRPVLEANRDPGARRASRSAWLQTLITWEPKLRARLEAKVHRYAGSPVRPPA